MDRTSVIWTCGRIRTLIRSKRLHIFIFALTVLLFSTIYTAKLDCSLFGVNRGVKLVRNLATNQKEHAYFALPRSMSSENVSEWSAVYDGTDCFKSIPVASGARLFIIILSAPGNIHKRQAIRKTWAADHLCTDSSASSVCVRFFVGQPQSAWLVEELRSEARKYGDLVITVDVLDSYSTLVKKVVRAFQFVEQCMLLHASGNLQTWTTMSAGQSVNLQTSSDSSHLHKLAKDWTGENLLVVKTDDDNFVNVAKLLTFAATFDFSKAPTIFGYKHSCAAVRRDINRKWYVSESDYPFDYYPNYVSGSLYMASFSVIRSLIDAAVHLDETVALLEWEDVFITGILAQLASTPVRIEWLSGISFSHARPVDLDACTFSKNDFNSHYFTADDMHLFWTIFSQVHSLPRCAAS